MAKLIWRRRIILRLVKAEAHDRITFPPHASRLSLECAETILYAVGGIETAVRGDVRHDWTRIIWKLFWTRSPERWAGLISLLRLLMGFWVLQKLQHVFRLLVKDSG
jgi:hypothetical protein